MKGIFVVRWLRLLAAVAVALLAGTPLHAQSEPSPDAPPLPEANHRVHLPLVSSDTTLPDAIIRVVGWNVESGGTDPNAIARQLAAFHAIDLWGLSEVQSEADAALFEAAVAEGEGARFESILGTTGGEDRLLILYNSRRFRLTHVDELAAPDATTSPRAPLYAAFTERTSGREFFFVVNHFEFEYQELRIDQAHDLREWARRQSLPVIAVGDYNLRWQVANGDEEHDIAYDLLTQDGVWEWMRPAQLVTTSCWGWPCAYHWVLDFVFTAGAAQDWPAASTIVVRRRDYPETASTSDHRPVMAVIALPR